MYRPVLPLVLIAIVTSGAFACAPTTTTTARGTTASATAPAPAPAILAEPLVFLAGGTLRARLPEGERQPDTGREPSPGVLVPSIHVVRRSYGTLSLTAVDTGERVDDDDFRPRVAESERTLRCVQGNAPFPVAIDVPGPFDMRIVGFVSDVACPGTRAPEARLWVRTVDGSVITITFGCLSTACLPDRANLLEAFVASITAGAPTQAPAGTRVFGPSSHLTISVEVPEGYFVRSTVGASTNTYELFRRHRMGAPWDSVSFKFLLDRARGSLRDDYARNGVRVRMVRGVLAGRRTRFLELKYRGRTERVVRLSLSDASLDVGMVGTTSQSLAELRSIVTAARFSWAEGAAAEQ